MLYAMDRKLRYELTLLLLHFDVFRIFVLSLSNKVGFGETGTAHKPSSHVFLLCRAQTICTVNEVRRCLVGKSTFSPFFF